MKKLVLLSLSFIVMTSCAISIGNIKKTPPPPVPEKIIEVDRAVGYLKTPNKTYTASSGDNSVVDLWDQYIQVHNDRNIDAIMDMEQRGVKSNYFLADLSDLIKYDFIFRDSF